MLKLNNKLKIIILSCFITLVFLILTFSMNNISNIKEIEELSTPLDSNSGNNIVITRPEINFDNDSMILNITDVFAEIDGTYFNGSSQDSPEIANFSVYLDKDNSFTGITGFLNDTDMDANWNGTLNLSDYSISPGIYYVSCYFENNSGLDNGTSPGSDRFAILGTYNITTASISYIQEKQQLNITNIMIKNDTSTLNDTGVSIAKWSIFNNNTGSNTSYTGNLLYDNNTKLWNATSIDVSNLTEGTYFIISYFRKYSQDSVSDLDREILVTFTVDHEIIITDLYVNYTGGINQELSMGVLANTSYMGGQFGRSMISGEANVSYVIIFDNGTSTSLSGAIEWDQSSWNKTISLSSLKEANYNVSINISHISGDYVSFQFQNSSSFEIIHVINLNIPKPLFNRGPATLDISGISAYCSYSKIGDINESEADSYFYRIYNSSNYYMNLSGDLSYNSIDESWESLNIDLENFTEGFYYVNVFFNNTIVPEGKEENSSNFEVIHKINFQSFKINYIGGLEQSLNITEVSATSSYFPYSQLEGYDAFRTYKYSFYNRTSKIPANPPLVGNLSWNGSYWNKYNIDVSKLPNGEYYVVLNFADNISINSYGSPNSNYFTISHVINVSKPIINYINDFDQWLNITNITVRTSYYDYEILNDSTANIYTYFIFNDTYEITGYLNWNDPHWEAIEIDVSELDPGQYKVRSLFSADETGSIYSMNSSIFEVEHVMNITTPSITYDSDSKTLDISGIQVYASNNKYIKSENESDLHIYQIFDEDNVSTGIFGNLTWNGSNQCWEALNLNIQSLNPGNYFIKVNFSINYISGVSVSNASETFTIEKPETTPPNLYWVFVLIILIIIIPFLIAFIRRLIIYRREENE
ncbi:MAG: hypothetical protein GF329_20820 [Candidatus Lokiarchaeota archaeon]|nr:hypothetical protein [Candidatus Lokiarchaeota archaeon]